MGDNVLTDAVGRRAVLQTLLSGAGVGVAWPAFADEHPVHEHLRDQARVRTAQKNAAAAAAAGRHAFLDAHQFETLTLLAEQIVPGSTKAESAAFIDALLAVDNDASQKRFLEALNAFDGLALASAKKPWKAVSEADRAALLTKASTADSGLVQDKGDPRAQEAKPAAGSSPTIRDYFDHLKGWISGAYYSSEIGMRELGWTGNVLHAAFPGCEHGSH